MINFTNGNPDPEELPKDFSAFRLSEDEAVSWTPTIKGNDTVFKVCLPKLFSEN